MLSDICLNAVKSNSFSFYLTQQPDQSDIEIPPKEKKFKGYFKIARHYGWALNQVFLEFGYETAIIVEGKTWKCVCSKPFCLLL